MERAVAGAGVRLTAHVHEGPGTPVVLLHGLAGHAGEWAHAAGWLRERHRVIALDQRGHGASERHPADMSRAAYVADVVSVLDDLGVAEAIVAGQSLGGHTALLTAAAHPDRVGALVLVEAGPGGAGPGHPQVIERWLASWPVPFPSVAAAAEFFGGGPAGAGWAAGLEERAGGWWPRFEPELMVASVAELSRRSYWAEWERVTCPALLVVAETGIIPAEEVREMVRRRPDTTVVRVPGAGHDVHLEQPDAVRAAIAAFLDGVAVQAAQGERELEP
ncbi:alpha/beta hydrolase [Microtetraspora sp. NBRC 13810]|uniref:alpha/beta fold hydrolase n=1 Tax=Microtetraspora sp. NBRC 13810 TaxID=3030990 RepID=UPI00249FE4DF|nr:alpha/beta hydrolase [Microtetraspora sp. NBRC 13810]GLW09684.1 alpha/beta hydrolase [Microtetraspora sp. NBRC 13810]